MGLKELSVSELIVALVLNDRQVCIEVNSHRGLTKKTEKEMMKIQAECKKRGLLTEEGIDDLNK